MALGRPVVSTAKGAEGLEIRPGKDFLLADDPESFAKSVRTLFDNSALYREIVSNARKTVEQKYDWAVSARKLLGLYEQLSAGWE